MKFYRSQDIENIANKRLCELEQMTGLVIKPPVPIDLLAEKVLGLDFLWDTIDEIQGEMILGAINPKKHLIILNESHRKLFEEKPGIERSTKGHEMGHWDLFIDKISLNHPTLFDEGEDNAFSRRRSSVGDVVIIKGLMLEPDVRELLCKIIQRTDEPREATAVNRYAAAISMPEELIRHEALKIDRLQWKNLYRLAKQFEVTISALKIRLEQLGLIYVDGGGVIYENRSIAGGQLTLEFLGS